MPRYFFHLKDGNDVLQDDIGEELATPEEARQHSLRVAFELGRNRSDRINARMCVLVTNPDNGVLFRTPLAIHYFKPT
jgi:hypothetical protein